MTDTKYHTAIFKNSFKIKLRFIILMLLTTSGRADAQNIFRKTAKNFQEGFVITHSNDTLQGQIEYREWLITPSSIEFAQQEQRTSFSATDIKGFSVNGNIFHSARVDMIVSPVNLEDLPISPTPTIARDTTIFLELLDQGEYDLYYHMDVLNKRHFFYRVNGKNLQELEYFQHYEDATKRKVVYKSGYKEQLKALAGACEEEDIYSDISYTVKEMVKFFQTLNRCQMGEEHIPVIRTFSKSKLRGAVFAGAHYTNYDYSEQVNFRYSEGTFSNFTPSLGLRMSYIFRRYLKQFSITSSIQYQHQKIERSYEVGKSWVMTDNYNLNHFLWEINLRYTLPFFTKISPYISVGPAYKYFTNPSLSKKKEVFDYERELILTENYNFIYSPFAPGFSLGIGTEWKNFNLELRYYSASENELLMDGSFTNFGSIQSNCLSAFVYYNLF